MASLCALHLLGNFVGNEHAKFYPIGLFFQPENLEMFFVVRIVEQACHGRIVLETFDEAALFVPIGEAHRPVDCLHAFGFAPVAHRLQQCVRHFAVVHKIDPTEACVLVAPAFVGAVVDYRRYTPNDFVCIVYQK